MSTPESTSQLILSAKSTTTCCSMTVSSLKVFLLKNKHRWINATVNEGKKGHYFLSAFTPDTHMFHVKQRFTINQPSMATNVFLLSLSRITVSLLQLQFSLKFPKVGLSSGH